MRDGDQESMSSLIFQRHSHTRHGERECQGILEVK